MNQNRQTGIVPESTLISLSFNQSESGRKSSPQKNSERKNSIKKFRKKTTSRIHIVKPIQGGT
jgi:hypothetical protein